MFWSRHLGCWGQNTSRIQNKEIYATLRLQGDIYKTESLHEFRRMITDQTDGGMLHFVMGDGGADYSQDQNSQEVILKQLLLCQFLCALNVLRKGGHFVCKAFDLFSEFSVGLLYILYQHFDEFCIIKPHTSRQANSERFVVGKGLKVQSPPVLDYLFKINDRLNVLKAPGPKRQDTDIVSIIPKEIIEGDKEFCRIVRESNNTIGRKQVQSLEKLHNFIRDRDLPGENQDEIRLACLEEWKLPNMPKRPAARSRDPQEVFEMIKGESAPSLHYNVNRITRDHVAGKCFINCRDWVVTLAPTGEQCYLMSMPNRDVYSYDFPKKRWLLIDGLSLPPRTFVLAQLVEETVENEPRPRTVAHILDAMMLGGMDIRRTSYTHRVTQAKLFMQSIDRDARVASGFGRNNSGKQMCIRVTDVHPFNIEFIRKLMAIVSSHRHEGPVSLVNA